MTPTTHLVPTLDFSRLRALPRVTSATRRHIEEDANQKALAQQEWQEELHKEEALHAALMQTLSKRVRYPEMREERPRVLGPPPLRKHAGERPLEQCRCTLTAVFDFQPRTPEHVSHPQDCRS